MSLTAHNNVVNPLGAELAGTQDLISRRKRARKTLKGLAEFSLLLSLFSYNLVPIFGAARLGYVISGSLSVILISVLLLTRPRVTRPIIFYFVFLVSFLPSVFYAELDPTWAKSQFLSLLMRALPVACYFLYWPTLKSLVRVMILSLWYNITLYALWIFGLLDNIDVGSIIDNSGAHAIIASLPFAFVCRRYGAAIISLSLIAASDSRMGLLVSFVVFGGWLLGVTIRKRYTRTLLAFIVIVSGTFIIFYSWDVFFPSFLPRLNESIPDQERRALQFIAILAIKENPLLGIGMGQFSFITKNIWGEVIYAHGMLSYIWAQSGLFPFLYYIFVAFVSIMRPAVYFSREDRAIFWAIALSSAASFLLFFTRSAQDSPYFFLSLALGLFAGQFSELSQPGETSFAHRRRDRGEPARRTAAGGVTLRRNA